ncbi:LOW QUALITY PROTEIN: L-seryl-tRNA(Sec) kinase-like [Dendronephthya gigantea]|uniref:LOW QUALITY PROTEIN: L-seryl-tRNA(Sec) kinase-like n=1 Tax=Dendronephthya gigantea TaxID=151771 RepID=UPI00106BAA91|nr:LOW QUALITY PROTEIN: L-seryl-tRNA(Sec) kinase-like [Dendronephthya gigantea]
MWGSNHILHVLVIDDNMYYRSMRYEYYQLARKASLSFAQVYLHCPVEMAIARNAQRSASVEENTITKMYHRMENPDPEKFSWETFSITVDHSMNSDEKWKTILGLLENAIVAPAPPLKVSDDNQKAKDRAISEKSIIHQLDQVLRKHISHKLEEIKVKNHSKDMLTREAATLNQRRKSIMELVKKDTRIVTNQVNILRDLDVDSEKDDSSSESTSNKTSEFEKTTDKSCSAITVTGGRGHSDERILDESFLLDNFWDVISREEFGDIARKIFEQT